ncbi:crossover junction endonuclease EME1B [Striga asiatica]|uniref:Crossover junction endonuclease EME1B n=1 Tax=Striga asiatica TaxID=4170 RepID=A0A5A7QR78_STRAF|nr:crossover junction endonuclease EME1B [Striga asiatica]
MSQPIPVDILSDSDSEGDRRQSFINDAIDLTTPPPYPQSKKKQRIETFSNPSNSNVLIIDDDPTPCKKNPSTSGPASSTPSFVAETPFSDASIVKCSTRKCSFSVEDFATEQLVVADTPMSELLKSKVLLTKRDVGVPDSDNAYVMSKPKSAALICDGNQVMTFSEASGFIALESDNESENLGGIGASKLDESGFAFKSTDELEFDSRNAESSFSLGTSVQFQKKHLQTPVTVHILDGCSSPGVMEDGIFVACDDADDNACKIDSPDQISSQQNNTVCYVKGKKKADVIVKPKRPSKEERLRLMEEKKRLKEQEKMAKAASKAEAAELKKCKKEMQKWEKGKYALKSIVAEIDKNVVELGTIGGYLLTRFGEKGISYRITSNPVKRTIIWNMVVPEEIAMIASERIEISYVLIVYEAEEFCNLVMNESLADHIQSVRDRYPHHTICYLTNRLMAYINKSDHAKYKNLANHSSWKLPAIEKVLAELATHYFGVHSRQCVDEAELAEHVVGLTCSLASCQFRKKLTRLSVNANGSIIPKDCAEKNLLKKNLWLKALVAIPKVQPRFAIAIWKKYPTMRSLLRVYMDPTKSVYEKEFLLKDLTIEGLFGDDRRLGEVCSKRIYRILMAQSANIKTDDVENGAGFFSNHSA